MNIARMSKAELLAEAITQGKGVSDNNTREEIIEMMNAPGSTKADSFLSPDRLSGKTRRILLAASEGPGGADPVTPSLNGKVWSIPRDMACDVPVEVLEILENAVMTVSEQNGKDADGRINWKDRNVRRYLFQNVQ